MCIGCAVPVSLWKVQISVVPSIGCSVMSVQPRSSIVHAVPVQPSARCMRSEIARRSTAVAGSTGAIARSVCRQRRRVAGRGRDDELHDVRHRIAHVDEHDLRARRVRGEVDHDVGALRRASASARSPAPARRAGPDRCRSGRTSRRSTARACTCASRSRRARGTAPCRCGTSRYGHTIAVDEDLVADDVRLPRRGILDLTVGTERAVLKDQRDLVRARGQAERVLGVIAQQIEARRGPSSR